MVVSWLWTKLKGHQCACALSINNIYVMYEMLCEFYISMIFSSKPIHKGIERFKTNKFSGRKDVTSKFSWVKQGKNLGILVQPMDKEKPYKAFSSNLKTRIKSKLKQSNLWTSEKLGKRNWIVCKISLQVLRRMKQNENTTHKDELH